MTTDPVHDRPPKLTADEMRDAVQSMHGSLLHAEHGAHSTLEEQAFHYAAGLVADLLWPAA